MLKLLRKDLILNGRVLALTYAFWSVFWLGIPALRPGGRNSFNAWAVMVSLACAVLPVTMVATEDKFKAGALACSLPVSRDSIVVARYVEGWILALGGAAIAVGVMWKMSAAGMTEFGAPAAGLPLGVVVTIGLVLAVFLPLTLRFGVAGLLGFLVAAQLMGVVALLAAAMFGSGGGIVTVIKAITGAVTWMQAKLGTVAFPAALVAAVLALNVASCRLSAAIYRRREF